MASHLVRALARTPRAILTCATRTTASRWAPLSVTGRSFADQAQAESATPAHMVRPTDFDKTALVKAHIYATPEDIPEKVSATKLKRARDYMRIRISIWMMMATAVGCGMMIYWGRRDRSKGESVSKQYMEKQEHLRARGLAEQQQRDNEAARDKAH